MNINESFPSKYLKAADIEGSPTVTIANVTEEEVGKDKDLRPVLYFHGEEKGIILNKTNATNISKVYGYETEDWIDKQVQLGTTMVDFQGQSVEAIRIYPPKPRSSKPAFGSKATVNTPLDAPSDDRFAPLPEDVD